MQKSRKLMTTGEKTFQVVNNLIMAILCVICIYPLWYVLVCSLSDPVLLYAQRGIMLWPLGQWSTRGYTLVMENPNIPIGFRNTLIYMGVGTLINMGKQVLMNADADDTELNIESPIINPK